MAAFPVTVGTAAFGGTLGGAIGGLALTIISRHPIISATVLAGTLMPKDTPNPPVNKQLTERK